MNNIKHIKMVCACLLLSAMSAWGQSPSTNVSSSSSMVNLGEDNGGDRYVTDLVKMRQEWESGIDNTNSYRTSSFRHTKIKVDAALEWYRTFTNINGRTSQSFDKSDIESAWLHAQVLSTAEGRLEAALEIHDAILQSELQRHVKRQVQAETGSLLIRLATLSQGEERDKYLSRASKIANELLYVQDVWFGEGVAMLAHIHMLNGDYDKALKLLDDFKPQLAQIEGALKDHSFSEDEISRMSPVPEVRYVTAVIMHEKAMILINQDGDKSEILKLLVGMPKAKQSGALQHFLNVAIRYPTSEWANDSAQRANNLAALLDTRYGLNVRFSSGTGEISSWGSAAGY